MEKETSLRHVLSCICVQTMPRWWNGEIGHLPAGSRNLVLYQRTWAIIRSWPLSCSPDKLPMVYDQGAKIWAPAGRSFVQGWEWVLAPLTFVKVMLAWTGCLMSCLWYPHLLESRGRDAQLGEKIKLLEASIDNVEHLVSNQRKGTSGSGVVEEHGFGVR